MAQSVNCAAGYVDNAAGHIERRNGLSGISAFGRQCPGSMAHGHDVHDRQARNGEL